MKTKLELKNGKLEDGHFYARGITGRNVTGVIRAGKYVEHHHYLTLKPGDTIIVIEYTADPIKVTRYTVETVGPEEVEATAEVFYQGEEPEDLVYQIKEAIRGHNEAQ